MKNNAKEFNSNYIHIWDYCGHCQHSTVICGKCGNNSCNGGSGLEPGHFWSDENPIRCAACPEANEFEKSTSTPEFTEEYKSRLEKEYKANMDKLFGPDVDLDAIAR